MTPPVSRILTEDRQTRYPGHLTALLAFTDLLTLALNPTH
jgi:hypothetical protein